MMSPRDIFSFGLLVVGVVASSVMLVRTRSEEPERREIPSLGIGYYLSNAEITGTGPSGQVLYRVTALRASQSLDDSSVDLDRIKLIYTPEDGVSWDFQADEGRIPPDGTMVQFFGRVLALAGDAAVGAAEARITTDYLEVDPETLVASTDSKVFIDYDGLQINLGSDPELESNIAIAGSTANNHISSRPQVNFT